MFSWEVAILARNRVCGEGQSGHKETLGGGAGLPPPHPRGREMKRQMLNAAIAASWLCLFLLLPFGGRGVEKR